MVAILRSPMFGDCHIITLGAMLVNSARSSTGQERRHGFIELVISASIK